MPPKTPTSSLSGSHTVYFVPFHLIIFTTTVIELFVMRVWYRTPAWIRRMCSGGASLQISTTPSSPANRLPLEVVETIVSHLIYDTRTLCACTMISYSWYIAAVPHLYRTLIIELNVWAGKFRWPNPIRSMHRLGLLPLAKSLSIQRDNGFKVGFSAKLFSRRTLHQFSALTNVRQLRIDDLDIPSFMANIQRYFHHFLPTLRSLILKEPKGSHRQIIYFIGLFPYLDNLVLVSDTANSQVEPVDDLSLIPPSAPPLRGFLIIKNLARVGLLKDMIDLFGGIRFRQMDLFNVDGVPLLLDACAETLTILLLYPDDPRGEHDSLT